MSYTIIFETKIVSLQDGRILHLSLDGCNNDNEGRDRHEFKGKIYTKPQFERYIRSFESEPAYSEGFDIQIGNKKTVWKDYGKHLRTMLQRATNWEELQETRGCFARVFEGITVTYKDNKTKSFTPGEELDKVFEDMMRDRIPYKYYHRNLRNVSDIKEIIKLLEHKATVEFYVGKKKKAAV